MREPTHLRVVRPAVDPPRLELPRQPWWDTPLFALFLLAMLGGLLVAVLVMVTH